MAVIPCEQPLRIPSFKCIYTMEHLTRSSDRPYLEITKQITKLCRYHEWVKALPVTDYRKAFVSRYHGRRNTMLEWKAQAVENGYRAEISDYPNQCDFCYLTIWADEENCEAVFI